jgi:hypothetical protein
MTLWFQNCIKVLCYLNVLLTNKKFIVYDKKGKK